MGIPAATPPEAEMMRPWGMFSDSSGDSLRGERDRDLDRRLGRVTGAGAKVGEYGNGAAVGVYPNHVVSAARSNGFAGAYDGVMVSGARGGKLQSGREET